MRDTKRAGRRVGMASAPTARCAACIKPTGIAVMADETAAALRAALAWALPPPAGRPDALARPHPAHRIDKATGGLLLVARTSVSPAESRTVDRSPSAVRASEYSKIRRRMRVLYDLRGLRAPFEKASKTGATLEAGPSAVLCSCIPTGMHGPACIFEANRTPFSLGRFGPL